MFMGGVHRNDALIGNYSSVRKTLKWTVKVVFHFIEEAFLNAYILNEKFGVKKMRFLAFKLEIIESIITKNQLPELQIYEHPKLGRHYLELIPPMEKKLHLRNVVLFVESQTREKKVDTNAKSAVHTQVCVQRHVSKSFTLKHSFKV